MPDKQKQKIRTVD